MQIKDIISGAIFDFTGYLTSLKEPIKVGSSEECIPLIENYQSWAKKRNMPLNECNAQIKNWEEYKDLNISKELEHESSS